MSSWPKLKSPHWSRNTRADDYLELLLVSAAATVVGVRIYLSLTGYPQIGGATLHIAHVLWGGLLMLVAAIMMMSFLSDQAWRYASIISGMGFGLFVDEIGKYLTHDNNYFFRPAVSLIYLIFVSLFLLSRSIGKATDLNARELQLNALVEDSTGQSWYSKRFQAGYRQFIHTIWAGRLLALLLAVQIMGLLGDAVIIFRAINQHHSVVYRLGLSSSLVALALTVVGVALVRRSKPRAYQFIRLAVLLDIFFIQIFSFYQNQLWALGTLALNIVVYSVIRYDSSHGSETSI